MAYKNLSNAACLQAYENACKEVEELKQELEERRKQAVSTLNDLNTTSTPAKQTERGPQKPSGKHEEALHPIEGSKEQVVYIKFPSKRTTTVGQFMTHNGTLSEEEANKLCSRCHNSGQTYFSVTG